MVRAVRYTVEVHLRRRRIMSACALSGTGSCSYWPCLADAPIAGGQVRPCSIQDRLVSRTDESSRGPVFGLASTGVMVGQAAGAILAGAVAQRH